MDISYLLLTQLLLIVLVGVLLWVIGKALLYCYRKLPMARARRMLLVNYTLTGLVLWLAILAQLAWTGFFTEGENMQVRMLVAYLPPLFLGFALLRSKMFRLFLRLIPLPGFLLAQSYRLPLGLLLWMAYRGDLVPRPLSLEGFNFDFLVGLSAVLAGQVFFRRGRILRLEAIVWNVFGLILLVNVELLALISEPGPWRVFTNEPAYRLVGLAPYIWIPGFLFPLGFFMHVYALMRLWEKPRQKRSFRGHRP